MSTQAVNLEKPGEELLARITFILGRLRRTLTRNASIMTSSDRILLYLQQRHKPLDLLPRNGPARPPTSRQTFFGTLLFFTFILASWQFLGIGWLSRGRQSLHPVFSRHTLPRNWTVTGNAQFEGAVNFVKPERLKVVALIFYGRPASVSILDCYLKVCSTHPNYRVSDKKLTVLSRGISYKTAAS
jgi:hypothetical protein